MELGLDLGLLICCDRLSANAAAPSVALAT